jgi:hypothetical protein
LFFKKNKPIPIQTMMKSFDNEIKVKDKNMWMAKSMQRYSNTNSRTTIFFFNRTNQTKLTISQSFGNTTRKQRAVQGGSNDALDTMLTIQIQKQERENENNNGG